MSIPTPNAPLQVASADLKAVQSYYESVKNRIAARKQEREEQDRREELRKRANMACGAQTIVNSIPQGQNFVNFMKHAIDNGVCKVELCNVGDAENERYRELLRDVIQLAIDCLCLPGVLFIEDRETGTHMVYSCSLMWDWSAVFPPLDDDDSDMTNSRPCREGHHHHSEATRNLMAKFNVTTLTKEDLKQFVE